jgi:hypothetical protein
MTKFVRGYEHYNEMFDKARPSNFTEINTESYPIDKFNRHPSFLTNSLNKRYYVFDEFVGFKNFKKILNKQRCMTHFLNSYSLNI